MGFLGIYRAVYDYEPRDAGELAITEGDVLYLMEKSEDDGWWKVKKKAGPEEEDEPVGLIPHNYIEECPAVSNARAIYEYTRQTDEELSFSEDAILEIFDTSDPDWILAGLDGEYGFVPSNYIETGDASNNAEDEAEELPPSLPTRPPPPSEAHAVEEIAAPHAPAVPKTPTASAAAASLAEVMQGKAASQAQSQPQPNTRRPKVKFEEPAADSDDESLKSPALPSRPPRPQHSASNSDDYGAPPAREDTVMQGRRNPGGFHMYNISEMVSVMGKRKKMPTTLGINLGTGTILIAPERAQDDPPQEWTAEKMVHYSREGKHVFVELVRPSKSIDFHAGAKDTAEEIVTALGELAGAARAEGLREVIEAGTKKNIRKGHILYDFMAQGADEVTVAAGDEVYILDDSKSEEWWQVRRLKNGKEGVVPSSYVEITGTVTPPSHSMDTGIGSGVSTVEQNRREELRLTKEAIKASKEPPEVGPIVSIQKRGSSLVPKADGNQNSTQQRSRRENGRSENGTGSRSKSKPDTSKVRTWTDRSKSFSVEAQFLGLKDGKIHLHKMNGVKIAVPIAKMSHEDLEYVESATGISLDDERPLADVKRAKANKPKEDVGVKIERNQKPEYDWFQFFLSCDVAVGLCERYAQAFLKDSMDESVLPDVDANILRTLGLREGDIIKVMRTLDAKFDRDRSKAAGDGDAAPGGLFSGPGGTLRNNTRKGRPAPAVQTSDVVDAAAFSKKETSPIPDSAEDAPALPTKTANKVASNGFDDDAWTVKPTKSATVPVGTKPLPAPQPVATQAAAQNSSLIGSMKDLSLLTEPLQPSQPDPLPPRPETDAPTANPASQTPAGATPSFFSALPPSSPKALARQRPTPSSVSPNQNSLIPPPPQRPLSAPQVAVPPSQYQPPLAQQMTGAVQGQVAPPGQSLHDIAQARMHQQYAAHLQQMPPMPPMPPMQPAMTGFANTSNMPYPVGNPAGYMQPMYTGMPAQSPFQDPGQFATMQPQATGFAGSFAQPQPQQQFGQVLPAGNVNNYLPPPLQPQITGVPGGIQPQPTGFNSFNSVSAGQPSPLVPQKTGPPPPVRFGVTGNANKLVPQPTGRRANLSQATPQNPFGF